MSRDRRTVNRVRPGRILDALADPAGGWRSLCVFLVLHLLVWTLYPSITQNNLDKWGDMAENVAWGQEWELGYHKHPPFFAWMSALWFEVFPNVDWAYFLLSQLNVVIGLAATWLLARKYLSPRGALLAVALLELVPFYTFLSMNFNANSILLSLWPLTTLCFCRAYATRRWLPSLFLGVFAALALLSKYFSLCLFAALFLVSISGKERRRYYGSASPYLSVLVALALLAPHIVWLVHTGFMPFRYAAAHVVQDLVHIGGKAAKFGAAQLLYLSPLIAALVAILGTGAFRRPRPVDLDDGRRRMALGLAFFPFLLTMAGALVLRVELSSVWGLPLWFFVGAGLLALFGSDVSRPQLRRGFAIILLFQLGILGASPFIGMAMERSKKEVSVSPRDELAALVTTMWHDRFRRPLKIIAGSRPYAESIAFYSSDHPSLFIDLDYAASPWISEKRLEEEGLAIVCLQSDGTSLARVQTRFGAYGERTAVTIKSDDSMVFDPDPVGFLVIFIPPRV